MAKEFISTVRLFLCSFAVLGMLSSCDDDDSNKEPSSDTVEFTATANKTFYYGNSYQDADEYSIMISDKPSDIYGNSTAGSTNYILGVYAEAKYYEYGKAQLTEGTYRLDTANTYAAGTMAADWSRFCYTDENMQDQNLYFTDGTLTVSREDDNTYLLELVATDEQGKKHHATYKGEINLLDERRESNLPSSNLKDDVNIDFTDFSVDAVYLGSQRAEGVDQWYFTFNPKGNEGHFIFMYLNTTATNGMTTDAFLGTFTACEGFYPNSSYTPGTFMAGNTYNNAFEGSHYTYLTDVAQFIFSSQAALTGGSVTITRNEETDTYTIDCNLEDAYGHHIKGTWTGKPEFLDESQPDASKALIRHKH